jgi:RNA polymerase sigma-70 factor (ECF subfamily)
MFITRDIVSESQEIDRARDGDDAAWERLIRLYQEPVFRLAYLLLGDPEDAEDAAQETFIRAYRALDRFDASRPLRPWLLQIAANLSRNRRRALGRYWAALQRRWLKEPPMSEDVESRVGSRMQSKRLWQAIRQLRQDDQEIIYLRYFLELPVSEAAEAAGLAEGTVKSRTSRALGRLRDVIEREFPDLKMDVNDGNRIF